MGNKSKKCESLFFHGKPKKPIITAENSSKWYDLHIVHPDGNITELGYSEIEKVSHEYDTFGSTMLDHAINPFAVCHYAAIKDMDVCSLALATMTRRWYNEYFEFGQPWLKHSLNINEE